EIIARPDDDTPRLIYADWLEENGRTEAERARAEFVRVQVEQERLPADDDRRAELAARQDQQLARHRAEGVRPLEPVGLVTFFRRGFPDGVALNSRLGGSDWLDKLDGFLRRAPARQLVLCAHGREWSDAPREQRRALPPPEGNDLARLADSPLLGRLTE